MHHLSLLTSKAGLQVLDTCAAPGSKTAQMLEMLHHQAAEPSGALPTAASWLAASCN